MCDDGERVEQIFRIEELKSNLEEIAQGQCIFGEMNGELPPYIEEQFLEQVLAYETAEEITHRDLLAQHGVALPAPGEMTDDELALKLIEIIHTWADLRVYLEFTNHLSDRELYTRLWEETFNESMPILPPESGMDYHLDLINSDSDDVYLKYYADERTRERWAVDFPEAVIPPHEDPPYDRDRHLPKPPPPKNPYDDPEIEAAWWAKCREKLANVLARDGIPHRDIPEEPISYAPDLACVWELANPAHPGTVAWWAISGDLPTTYLSATDCPDPRTFLRILSRRWNESADAMEGGNPSPELAIGQPKDWPHLVPLLRFRAQILEHWAEDDDAWEEE